MARIRDLLALRGTLALIGILIMQTGARGEDPPRTREMISDVVGEVGYLRPGDYSEEEAETAGFVLEEMVGNGATALVFDLRVEARDGGVREAARWLDLFLPAGAEAFRIRGREGKVAAVRSVSEAKWGGAIAVLVDGETGNVGEIVAWVLSKDRGALVMGWPTSGRGGFFLDGESGGAAKELIADVLVGDGEVLAGKAVVLNDRVEFDLEKKAAAFGEVEEGGLETVVKERVRPRRNEAALIAGTDPELPFLLEQSAGARGGTDGEARPAVDDPVLRRAMDTLAAAGAVQLRETVEHVKRREWRLEETRRKLEELREEEASKQGGSESEKVEEYAE